VVYGPSEVWGLRLGACPPTHPPAGMLDTGCWIRPPTRFSTDSSTRSLRLLGRNDIVRGCSANIAFY
jgi:hypothetical protein